MSDNGKRVFISVLRKLVELTVVGGRGVRMTRGCATVALFTLSFLRGCGLVLHCFERRLASVILERSVSFGVVWF